MAELRGNGTLELGKDPPCEHLAELHAPLIEAVDVPNHPLREHAVLVEGHKRTEDRRGETIVEDRARGNVARELPMGDESGRCPLGGHLLGALSEGERLGLGKHVCQEHRLMASEGVERMHRAEEVARDPVGALMDELIEGMLSVGARLSPHHRAGGAFDERAVALHPLSVALH